jgi:hypothetical protein
LGQQVETLLIERRHIEHVQLLQLGKTFLLLARRQELLVKLPAITRQIEEIVPIEELGKAS